MATLALGGAALIPPHWLPGIGLAVLPLPLLALPHLFLLFFWLFRKPLKALPNVISLGLLLIPVMSQLPLNGGKHWAGADQYSLVSYNVRGFYERRGVSGEIADYLKSHDVDVLCAQEVRKSKAGVLKELFMYSTFAPPKGNYGVAIYSQYPIVHARPLIFERTTENKYNRQSACFADIALPFDTIRFINVHLISTGVQDEELKIEDTSREGLWNQAKLLARKMRMTDKTRSLQGFEVIDWIDDSPHPVILTGDFNQVPAGSVYAQLLWRLSDPYIFKGTGTLGSFVPLARRFAPIRIDWSLFDRQLDVDVQFIDPVEMSDHRPIISIFGPAHQED